MRKPYLVRPATPGGPKGQSKCIHCGQPATKEALFRRDGVILIEKYCDDCLQPWIFRLLMQRYANDS